MKSQDDFIRLDSEKNDLNFVYDDNTLQDITRH
jgi:hypothetical protein